jgi:hypothetical protein
LCGGISCTHTRLLGKRFSVFSFQFSVFSFQFAVHGSHLLIDVTQTVDSELKTEN